MIMERGYCRKLREKSPYPDGKSLEDGSSSFIRIFSSDTFDLFCFFPSGKTNESQRKKSENFQVGILLS